MIAQVVLVVLFVLGANALVLVNNPVYCFSWDPIRPQIAMFGTTTPYEQVRGQRINSDVSQCTPSRFWYQGRHGSRYPSVVDNENVLSETDTINIKILENYNSYKTTLCPADAELIKKWNLNPNFALDTPGALTEAGWTELTNIGSRLQEAFPTLLPKQYTREHYYIRHSPIPRTRQSAQAFSNGLFGPSVFDSVNYEGGDSPDLYLTPYNSCPDWMSLFNFTEPQLFEESSNYQKMIRQVNEKLGFHGSDELDPSIISKIMLHCKYEQILDLKTSSPFCSAFSIANHQVDEYYMDLLFYYLNGYGNSANRRLFENMSCSLLQAMLKFLQSNDPSDQKAKFWFGHDITLHFMFVALGVYEDEVPLTGSNFSQQTSRKWKTSLLTPMAANIVVVRYDCADGDNDILFLHNENPLLIPGCQPNGVCKQSLVMQRYSRFLNANCDSIFCTNSD